MAQPGRGDRGKCARSGQRGDGGVQAPHSVRGGTRDYPAEAARAFLDPDDSGPDLRPTDWSGMREEVDLFLGRESRGWISAPVSRCSRERLAATAGDRRAK